MINDMCRTIVAYHRDMIKKSPDREPSTVIQEQLEKNDYVLKETAQLFTAELTELVVKLLATEKAMAVVPEKARAHMLFSGGDFDNKVIDAASVLVSVDDVFPQKAKPPLPEKANGHVPSAPKVEVTARARVPEKATLALPTPRLALVQNPSRGLLAMRTVGRSQMDRHIFQWFEVGKIPIGDATREDLDRMIKKSSGTTQLMAHLTKRMPPRSTVAERWKEEEVMILYEKYCASHDLNAHRA